MNRRKWFWTCMIAFGMTRIIPKCKCPSEMFFRYGGCQNGTIFYAAYPPDDDPQDFKKGDYWWNVEDKKGFIYRRKRWIDV